MDDREERMARMRERFAQNPSWQRHAAERKRERKAQPMPPPLPEYRGASLDVFRQFARIGSLAVYSMGSPDPEGYEVVFDPGAPALVFAHHVRAALAASRFVPPSHPEFDRLIRMPKQTELDALEAEDLARAGVKTRRTLYRDAAHLALRLQDGEIELRPMRYGRAGWWEGIRGAATVLPEDATDEVLGAAILEALATSRAAR